MLLGILQVFLVSDYMVTKFELFILLNMAC